MTVPVVCFRLAGAASPAGSVCRPYTVVYDGACRVCGRLVSVLKRWDTQGVLEIVPSQTPGVRARFPWIPPRAFAESVQVVGPGGRTWQGAAALEQLLDVLPRGRGISWIFDIPFMRRIAERVYRWFARNRYQLACGAHCQCRPLDLDYADADTPLSPASRPASSATRVLTSS